MNIEDIKNRINELNEEIKESAFSKAVDKYISAIKHSPENPNLYTVSTLTLLDLGDKFFTEGCTHPEELHKYDDLYAELSHLQNELEHLELLNHYKDIGDMPVDASEN